MFDELISGLFQPFELLLNPSSRLYWLYCLSSIVIALVCLLCVQKATAQSAIHVLFSRKLWLTKSSGWDFFYLFLNSTIRTAFIIPYVFSYASGAIFVQTGLVDVFGVGPDIKISTEFLIALFTVVFFLVDDLSRFSLHWLLHKNTWLWQLHKVHHSAEQLTPVTLYRMHPVEMAFYYFRSLLVFSGVVGTFLFLFAGKLTGMTVLGVNVFLFLFNVLGANLRHSPVPLSYGRWERWLISPVQHQIHHSIQPVHFDKNFGSVLSVWDRLAGTWRSGVGVNTLTFGVAVSSKKDISASPFR